MPKSKVTIGRGPGSLAREEKIRASLVVRGWQRAGAWAVLFGAAGGGIDYPTPTVIYAANPNGTEDGTSNRPYETILPLAARLGVKPLTIFEVGEEPELVSEILPQTGVILISWEHKAITRKIVPAIFQDQPPKGVPHTWDENRYDVVFRLDRSSPEHPWSFRQLCACLLAGDSNEPLC
jgi:hypothetical protein